MNTTIKEIKVIANSGAFGVATLTYNDLSYEGDPEKFLNDIGIRAAVQGYPSILSYKGNMQIVAACWRNAHNKQLFEKALNKYAEEIRLQKRLDAFKKIEKADPSKWQALCDDYNKQVDFKMFFIGRDGKLKIAGGDMDFHKRLIKECSIYLDGIKDTLECMGYDPEDKLGIRIANQNMGIDRTF